MATAALRLPHRRWLRSKYLLFAAILAMMAYVLFHNERFLINNEHPIWTHYEPFK